jgi:diamine N-acetyltransferase
VTALGLRPATPGDIPFIMATERRPGNERVVGRWEEAHHRAEMSNPATAYFVGEEQSLPRGFAIVIHLDDPSGNVQLKRLAAADPGRSHGRQMLRLISAEVFRRPGTHRFWLTLMPYNERARRLYAGEGFSQEGAFRQAALLPTGERVDQIVMSLLRPEWERRAHRL